MGFGLFSVSDFLYLVHFTDFLGIYGNASVSDPTQWVHVITEPTKPSLGVPSETDVTCYDVTTHVTYKVFYTRVGNTDNAQSVVTNVRAEYSKQSKSRTGRVQQTE